ncbi:MAG: hypothetical protein H7336_00500 [Bacteriovorax sp.]|nr:hypothetical protein [Bacteriovorax sp.]
MSADEHEEIRRVYHRPHWNEVRKIIGVQIKKDKIVVHIRLHSFTPVLYGEVHTSDLGVLYDSRIEKYDGLTSEVIRLYSSNKYIGFELEVNQALTVKLLI